MLQPDAPTSWPAGVSARRDLWPTVGRRMAWFALTVLAIAVIDGTRIQWRRWDLNPYTNYNLAEGIVWHQGRLDIPNKEGVQEVVVDADVIRKKKTPVVVYDSKKAEKKAEGA